MPLRTDWQHDNATTAGDQNDELAHHLGGVWNGRSVILALRTPARDVTLSQAVLDALVANTTTPQGAANPPDPRNDAGGWRIYFP